MYDPFHAIIVDFQKKDSLYRLMFSAFLYVETVNVIDYLWLSLTIFDCHWLSFSVIDCHFLSLTVIDCHWLSLTVIDCQWLSLIVSDCHWLSVTVSDCHWNFHWLSLGCFSLFYGQMMLFWELRKLGYIFSWISVFVFLTRGKDSCQFINHLLIKTEARSHAETLFFFFFSLFCYRKTFPHSSPSWWNCRGRCVFSFFLFLFSSLSIFFFLGQSWKILSYMNRSSSLTLGTDLSCFRGLYLTWYFPRGRLN